MRFHEKVIIVTGSTTGIGKAIAKSCVEEGAFVLLHGLEEDLGNEVIDEINAERSQVSLIVEDLADPAAPQKIVDFAIHEFGQIHGIVNNAAWVKFTDIAETDAALFDQIIAVNTRAPLFLIKAALPHLEKTRGSVVNIGSVNAYSGEPNLLPYSISKGGLMSLTRNLGDTLHREHGVRVNQVNPGWILTENEIQRKRDQGMPDDWYTQQPKLFVPAGRLFEPKEIAEAVLYFLSDECGPVSGSILDVEQHPMIGRNPPKC
ncbi:MAG: SDR family oxidoreductase [Verrucomicrobiota bacterium]